jgi:hypothetical protein
LPNSFKTLVYGAMSPVFSQYFTFKWDFTTFYYVCGKGSTELSIKICVQTMLMHIRRWEATLKKTLLLEVSWALYYLYAWSMALCCVYVPVWHYIKQTEQT